MLYDSELKRLKFDGATKPRYLVTDNLILAAPKSKGGKPPDLLYTIAAGPISMLDGYVSPDTTFMYPREIAPS